MLHFARTFRLQAAVLLLLAFGVQACSDGVVHGNVYIPDAGKTDAPKQFSGDIGFVDGALAQPDGTEADAGDQDIAVKREIILMLNASIPQVIAPAAVLPIYAKVIDYSVGAPASAVPLFWEIIANDGINGPGKGALDSQNTFTDSNGLSGNVFHANKSPSTGYKIRISCEGAPPVTVDISVTDLAKGSIKVKMLYDNQVPLGQVTVRLMNAPFTCASFKPVSPPDVFLASLGSTLNDTPQFDNLPADKKYGVYVLGKSLDNHLTAAGCADAVLVVDKQTTEVTVTLTTLPLLASGAYDMTNHFDFTGAIPGNLGKILDTAVQIFYDPGAFVIEQVKNLVKQLLPSIIVDAVFSLFENQLAKVVTDWLLNSSPPWLQGFFQIGQDVLQVVKNLEMLGVLKIYKVSNDFFVKGEIDFTGVNLYWKLGCDKKDPNYATCGQIPLLANNLSSDPNFPLDFLAGTFTGSISQQTHLSIDSGTIKLNYGKLILFVLTNVILKKITGETTFVGAMQKLVNCAGIAKGIGGSILGKLGLSESTIKGVCDSTVSLLVLPIEQLLGGLALDSKLSLNGQCLMHDEDDDLKVDTLTDGTWVGNITSDTPGKPFKGDFSAVRQPGL
jgi:hypothetical protein